MDNITRWDRAAWWFAPYAGPAVTIAAPLFLVSYAVMWTTALSTWPVWATVVALVAHAVTAIGIPLLFEQPPHQGTGAPPQ